MSDSPKLVALGTEIWGAELHQVLGGTHQRMRMTVVRRTGGALWLHSPIRIDDALATALAELGEVRDLVAPNRFHNLFAAQAKQRYPSAKLWAAPGLAKRKPALPIDATVSEEPVWGAELAAVFMQGAPFWSEHVFFHAPSRTLICTDLLFNVRHEPSWFTRLLYRGIGVYGRFGTNRVWRLLAKDRHALSASLDRILAWDIHQVAMAHGDPIPIDDKQQLKAAFARLRP